MGRWCSVRCDCVRCLWQHIARVEMRERWRARSGAAGALGWAGSGRAKRAGSGSRARSSRARQSSHLEPMRRVEAGSSA